MRIEWAQSDTTQWERRPCHRCGWKANVQKMSRRGNRSFGVGTAFRWLCDDCCDDLGVHRATVGTTGVTLKRRTMEVDRRIVA